MQSENGKNEKEERKKENCPGVRLFFLDRLSGEENYVNILKEKFKTENLKRINIPQPLF